jgi:hypothetical protein
MPVMTNLITAPPRTLPHNPTTTWELKPGPVNPTNYRRLLEILFAPDTETEAIDPDRLHTQAA